MSEANSYDRSWLQAEVSAPATYRPLYDTKRTKFGTIADFRS